MPNPFGSGRRTTGLVLPPAETPTDVDKGQIVDPATPWIVDPHTQQITERATATMERKETQRLMALAQRNTQTPVEVSPGKKIAVAVVGVGIVAAIWAAVT